MKSILAGVLSLAGLLLSPVQAVQYDKAKITKIVDGDAVFINQKKALTGQTAAQGSTLRTGESRASLLFNPTAIGLMSRNTVIQLGRQCFRGESGTILVNGKLIACLGDGSSGRTKLAGSRGTTYVLETNEDASTSIYVLAGEVAIADSEAAFTVEDDNYDISNLYPTLSPTLELAADFLALEGPRQYPAGFGSLSVFAPLSQSKSSNLSYGYASSSTDFERYFGVDVEFGHRWFDANDQTTKGVFLGYSNYQSSACSNSYVKTGVQVEKSRFRYGASGGFKADACTIGFSYGQLDFALPIAKLSPRRSAHLTLSPYILWGNDIMSLQGSKSSNDLGQPVDVAAGGRLTLDLPVTDSLKLSGYGSYDDIYGFAGGAKLSYRLPIGGPLVRDPNSDEETQAVDVAMPDVEMTIGRGETAVFSPQGDLIGSIQKISPQQLERLMVENLKGQDRIPESLQLADLAEDQGVLTTELSGILGVDFDQSAGQPISSTLNDPYPAAYPPSLKYQPSGYSWDTWRRKSLSSD